MPPYKFIQVQTAVDHVSVIRLNRPEAANATNTPLVVELTDALETLAHSRRCRCVVLTAAGERHFCAGADLVERRGMSEEALHAQHLVFEKLMRTALDFPLPIIAAVNGIAFGGGCELAMNCDFIFAAETARFAQVEVSRGLIPGGGGTQMLPRAVGSRRAKEIIFSAQPFSAREALAWGLVNRVVPQSELMTCCLQVASQIAVNSPLAVRQAKKAIDLGQGVDLPTALRIEIDAYAVLLTSEDRLEGLLAFQQKRVPVFKGV